MKKVFSLVLAVVLAFGMCTVAFAAPTVTAIKPNVFTEIAKTKVSGPANASYVEMDFGTPISSIDRDFKPDTSIKLYIIPSALDGGNYNTRTGLTAANLRNEKITIRRSIAKGADLIKSIESGSDAFQISAQNATHSSVADAQKSSNLVTKRYSYVKINFVEHFVSVNDKDIDCTIYLYLNGRRQTNSALNLSGTMTNPVETVSSGDDYVSSEDGAVVKCEGYVRGIEMYLGDGVTAKLNMFSGTKYYGTARQEITQADEAVMNQYPEIETIYVLRTVNLSSTGTKITFDIDGTYYVYNADGTYLGTTAQTLAYSTKYYLARTQITMKPTTTTATAA